MKLIKTGIMLLALMITSQAIGADDKTHCREIKVALKEFPKGNPLMPQEIESADAAAKLMVDDAAKKEIGEIDFKKSKLVFFTWSGSGMDNLEFKVEDAGKKIEFTYTRGKTKDLRGHAHLYVIAKESKITLK